jgi:hypothetical protein
MVSFVQNISFYYMVRFTDVQDLPLELFHAIRYGKGRDVMVERITRGEVAGKTADGITLLFSPFRT